MNIHDLLRKVHEAREQAVERLVRGGAASYEDYRSQISRIRTFEEVVEMTRPIEEKHDERST